MLAVGSTAMKRLLVLDLGTVDARDASTSSNNLQMG
jgi:hypothetical protein